MYKRQSLIILIIIFSIFTLGFTNDIQDIKMKPLKIGGDNNYPPYEFIDNNQNFRGFNVDIIRAIAIELGLEIELIPNDWDNTMISLKNGEIDGIQGMTITPERSRTYDFTEEIVINSQNIFVLKDTSYIKDIRDLDGKRVAIQANDVTNEIIRSIPNLDIIEKVNQLEALESLLSGEVDAFIGNRLTGIFYVQTFDLTETVKIVGEPLYTTKYSIAVKKGDTELLNILNTGLKAIKDNGTYDKIYTKWFGENIFDVSQKWKNLFSTALVALLLSSIFIYVIYYWNRRLKEEVDIRTKEVIALNNIAMQNDKMQSLGKLSASIAHELRNPLTSIKAFVDLIPLKYEDERFRDELIKVVPNEVKRLDELVSSLLDYSKPKSPKPSKIILDNILSEILTLLKQKIREKNIQIFTKSTDICFYADIPQMKQILINIILNSIDAIEDNGKIEISGSVENSKAVIKIKDNGIGVPDEMLNKLFDPFITSKKTGYGIGLSVTHRLVNENNGEIKLNSELSKGTEVILYMPRVLQIGDDNNV
ncbi:transporter substrate-binding domain-containing protein [Tissierella sp. MB52-C2]|uniref:transporter substrate-binding domain-containing protein n=1 Tax=Tissierella sp. MB52-C2 TaxID=3070999 RepID=UPI00280AC025|nr:transporter substrate-binding domain-containing protein [Tissierella sp. MB52-C2]WMM25356.1 transporter substrate-binding domain-containing protein [Tissierella sp. MB52-C2]